MKTNDKELIVERRVYYYIDSQRYRVIPFILKIKAIEIYGKTSWLGPGVEFNLYPGSRIFSPIEIRNNIFKSFEKAKAKAIRIAKSIKKDIDEDFAKLYALTKGDL